MVNVWNVNKGLFQEKEPRGKMCHKTGLDLLQDHYPTLVVKGVKVRLAKSHLKLVKLQRERVQSTNVNLAVEQYSPKSPNK